ncbi:hypothetical protein B1757_00215 [Acidithiobacillus marinus]|uniref:Penicillin-binding protein activator LpoB n=1 Tax=Acidithiobacillus marinus TaxID=187490 RepID=A0A2I1DQR4_9PROT|nr:hypothetical protein [Acidithiobacillus marinus]PKY12207.1 hypothetical protein B1757_00215 [Acidithiobacillus marinus]
MKTRGLWIPVLILMLSGCAGMTVQSAKPVALSKNATWTILPFANNTETPLANERAAALAAGILQSDNQKVIGTLPIRSRIQSLLGGDWKKEYTAALSRAHNDGIHYALGGSVDEWNYRAGINAEPVVTMTLWIVNVPEQKVIWTGVGSAHGGSLGRGGTGGLAQGLIQRLLQRALH